MMFREIDLSVGNRLFYNNNILCNTRRPKSDRANMADLPSIPLLGLTIFIMC